MFGKRANLFTEAEFGGKVLISGRYLPPGWNQYPIFVFMLVILAVIVVRYHYFEGIIGWIIGIWILGVILSPIYFILVALWFFFVARKQLDIIVSRDELCIGKRAYQRSETIELMVFPHKRSLSDEKRDKDFRGAVEIMMAYGSMPVVIAVMRERDTQAAEILVIQIKNALERTADAPPDAAFAPPAASPAHAAIPRPASRPEGLPGG